MAGGPTYWRPVWHRMYSCKLLCHLTSVTPSQPDYMVSNVLFTLVNGQKACEVQLARQGGIDKPSSQSRSRISSEDDVFPHKSSFLTPRSSSKLIDSQFTRDDGVSLGGRQ